MSWFRKMWKRKPLVEPWYRNPTPELAPEPEPIQPEPLPTRHRWYQSVSMRYQLSVQDVRILKIPLSAYVASPARFTEVVTAEQMQEKDRWVAVRLEIDLHTLQDIELEDPEWVIWLFERNRMIALHGRFELEGSTLIVTPNDAVRVAFQEAAVHASSWHEALTVRVVLNGAPIRGSDAPARLVDLDVLALSQEAPSEPTKERRRIIKAFGEARYSDYKLWGSGGPCAVCGNLAYNHDYSARGQHGEFQPIDDPLGDPPAAFNFNPKTRRKISRKRSTK